MPVSRGTQDMEIISCWCRTGLEIRLAVWRGSRPLLRIRQVRTQAAEFLHTLESGQAVFGDFELPRHQVQAEDDDWMNISSSHSNTIRGVSQATHAREHQLPKLANLEILYLLFLSLHLLLLLFLLCSFSFYNSSSRSFGIFLDSYFVLKTNRHCSWRNHYDTKTFSLRSKRPLWASF